ncbi:MAG TPA: hypothetical protein VMJ30_10585 [Gemmatimonadales bacterium]|nr:hypothetical protein [Gemmatimonadales bacterium]
MIVYAGTTVREDAEELLSAGPPVRPSDLCNRCGFAVVSRAFGCKNPCPNCGTVYPLGDCSD